MDPDTLTLHYYPDPVLKRRADPVDAFDDAFKAGVRRMFQVMYEHGGIGLAAPQVGWSRRVFVVNLTGDPERLEEEQVFVNPTIRTQEGTAEDSTFEEGCLSFPGIRIDIARPDAVVISARDIEGNPFELEADELLARCVQHELDHLDGLLFISRVSVVARMTIRKDLKELERRYKERQTV